MLSCLLKGPALGTYFNRGNLCNGIKWDRTTSMPMSVLRLIVDKGQGPICMGKWMVVIN